MVHMNGLKPDGFRTFGSWRDEKFLSVVNVERRIKHGRRVGVINGCFDLLHVGHVNLIAAAASMFDDHGRICLVVLLNSDASVSRLKGQNRPIIPEAQRMWMVAQLPRVEAVALFDEDTPAAALETLKPDYLFKGEEYRGTDIPGAAHCLEVVFIPKTPGVSTTEIERRVLVSNREA
jgi:D-beta-D-heptose 7-phosphate kinase/D-beta-D-heptose 1-phosphate adenosyltransferase